MAQSPKQPGETAAFVRRVLIVIGLTAAVLLLWKLRLVLVLLFGAILVATTIRAVAEPFQRRLHLPEAVSITVSILVIVTIVAATGWMMSSQVSAQATTLAETLPRAVAQVDNSLAGLGLNHPVQSWMDRLSSQSSPVVSNLGGWLSSLSEAVVGLLVVLFGGIFLASQPRLYRTGAIKLVPPARRALVAEAMEESETALRLWLKAQVWAMLLIGIMTWVGLRLLGVQSPLVLSLIAGVLEFIPYAGAILSSVPAILVALVQSPELTLWVVAMYLIVHHVEAYVIQPIIQQFAVQVPAVVMLFSLLGFSVLFGVIGIILAAPMTVVGYVLVKRLYVVEALDTPTPIPGKDKT